MLQTCLPVLLFADGPSKVILRGGTNADMAPPIDYFLMVQETNFKTSLFPCYLVLPLINYKKTNV